MTIPYHHRPRSAAVRSNHHGLHHETTTVERIRLHTHYHRSRLYKSGTVHPLQRDNHKRGRGKIIPAICLPSLRNTQETYYGQRIAVHIDLYAKSLPSPRNQTKYLVSISPTNGQTVRTK